MSRMVTGLVVTAALVPLLLARVPGPALTQSVSIAAACIVAAAAFLGGPSRTYVAAAGIIAAVVLVAIPRPSAGLVAMPGPVGGLAACVVILSLPAATPRSGLAGVAWVRAMRLAPVAGLFVCVALATWSAGFLPAPYGSSYEVRGPAGIIAAGLTIGLALAAVAGVRAGVRSIGRALVAAGRPTEGNGLEDAA